MSKDKGKRDVSPGKKPGPLTKKERKERKKKRKEKHVLWWMHVDTVIINHNSTIHVFNIFLHSPYQGWFLKETDVMNL